MKRHTYVLFAALGGLATAFACSDDATGTDGQGASAATTTGAGGNPSGSTGSFSGTGGMGGSGTTTGTGTSTGSGPPPPPTEIAECQGMVYDCGDLVDNDADGLLDYQDPDCLGPCDNTEDSFFGGIPGQPGPPCKVECYWDNDSGPGNDDCFWDHGCDTHEVPPDYYPEPSLGDACEFTDLSFEPFNGQTCSDLLADQSQTCLDVCLPLTPNGCDCFGCCELPAGSGKFVWSGSEGLDGNTVCTLADINDPTKCHPCDPVPSCFNDCGDCELCVGKPTLGPECLGEGGGGGGPVPECGPGITACGTADLPPCPSGYYCITGCCIAEPQ